MLSKSLPAESALQKLPYTHYDYKYVSQILAVYTDIECYHHCTSLLIVVLINAFPSMEIFIICKIT